MVDSSAFSDSESKSQVLCESDDDSQEIAVRGRDCFSIDFKLCYSLRQRNKMLCSIRKKAREKMVLIDKMKNQAEAGNATKRMRCNDNDASVGSKAEPHGHVNLKFSAFERAKELQQTLALKSPSFLKLLQSSDIYAGTFLEMPENFCDEIFPRRAGSFHVVDFVLVDGDERQYMMSYSFCTHRFLGKWRDFYLEHKLTSGDALVFHQTGNYKFKVYILKANESTQDGMANGISSNPDIHDNPYDYTESTRTVKTVKEKYSELPAINFQKEKTPPRSNSNSTPLRDLSDHGSSSNIDSYVTINTKISNPVLNFMDVKTFEDFKIYVNGKILDMKIPAQCRVKYYELCNSQKMFLHEGITGIGSNLVVGMIKQLINIAESIKATNISTSVQDLKRMEKCLKSLEDLGMAVGFVRDRINKIVKVLYEHQTITESKKMKLSQIEDERSALREEVSKLEELIKSVTAHKSSLGYFKAEVTTLKKKSRELESVIKEVVDSAW